MVKKILILGLLFFIANSAFSQAGIKIYRQKDTLVQFTALMTVYNLDTVKTAKGYHIVTTNATSGATTILKLVGKGITPTFAAPWKKEGLSATFDTTRYNINIVECRYDGVNYWYKVINTTATGIAAGDTVNYKTLTVALSDSNEVTKNGYATIPYVYKSEKSLLAKVITKFGNRTLAITLSSNGGQMSTNHGLSDAAEVWCLTNVEQDTTVTGVRWFQYTAGSYTADAYNGVGLWSINYATGSYTLIASSTNDGNIWKASSFSKGEKAFTTPVIVKKGVYIISALYNQSAQVTQPLIYSGPDLSSHTDLLFSNTVRLSATLAGQSAFSSPQAASGLTGSTDGWHFELY